jgi:hypothetical protein
MSWAKSEFIQKVVAYADVFKAFPLLSSGSFEATDLTLRNFIHYELIFERQGVWFQSSACEYPVFLIPFVEEAVFSPTYVFGAFVKSRRLELCGRISVTLILFRWSVRLASVFVPVPCCFHYQGSAV